MWKHILTVILFSSAIALADEQTRAVQQNLKEQGFYFGETDGNPGPETDAAIKRYQIRNGMEVTGKLDEATLKALIGESPAAPTAEPVKPEGQPPETAVPTNPEASSTSPQLQSEPESAVTRKPLRGVEVTAPRPERAVYAFVFRDTPYASAPDVVQNQTVSRAQVKLAQRGFYKREIDGVPGEQFQLALVRFQASSDLPKTGRLDLETLSLLTLLPGQSPIQAPVQRVYRGHWVR